MLSYRENIRAILDTNLPQIKDEVKEVIVNKITGLEQEPILDKIIEEISSLTLTDNGNDSIRAMAELYSLKITVLMIIAKYRQEGSS